MKKNLLVFALSIMTFTVISCNGEKNKVVKAGVYAPASSENVDGSKQESLENQKVNSITPIVKITGTNTYIDVTIDDRTVRISGELIVGGFVCYKSSMTNWLIPENEPLTEEDKKDIIQKVTEKTAGSHMIITFE